MRWLKAVTLTCDTCSGGLTVLAPRRTPPTAVNLEWMQHEMELAAKEAGWLMEGPSLLAGDFCPRCVLHEVGPRAFWN